MYRLSRSQQPSPPRAQWPKRQQKDIFRAHLEMNMISLQCRAKSRRLARRRQRSQRPRMPQRRRQRSQVLQSGCQRLHSEMRLHSEPKRTTRREEDNSLAISICPQCFRICLRYHRMDDAKDYRISKLFQLCQKQKSFRCAKLTV